MTTHWGVERGSPASESGLPWRLRHRGLPAGRDRPSDVRRGGPKARCDEDRDPAWNGRRRPRTTSPRGTRRPHPRGGCAATRGQTRAAGTAPQTPRGSGRQPPSQGVGTEGGQSEGQRHRRLVRAGPSCPRRPTTGSRSICRAAYLGPTADDTGQGTPTVRQMIETSYTSGDRILMRLGGVAAILAFAPGTVAARNPNDRGRAVRDLPPHPGQPRLLGADLPHVPCCRRRGHSPAQRQDLRGVAAAVALIGGRPGPAVHVPSLAGAVIGTAGRSARPCRTPAVIPTILVTFTTGSASSSWRSPHCESGAPHLGPRARRGLPGPSPVNAPNLFDVYAFGIAWWGIAMLRSILPRCCRPREVERATVTVGGG